MIALGLLAVAAILVASGAPWWVQGAVVLPVLLVAPGAGWSRLAGPPTTRLQSIIDTSWIGLAVTWADVALVREIGLHGAHARAALLGLAAAWTVAGWLLGRRRPGPLPGPGRERLGTAAVLVAVVGVALWRHADVARPLDGHWYLEGAAEGPAEALPLRPGAGWADTRPLGWREAGAWRLRPAAGPHTLIATAPARGRVVLAVRGPVGTRIRAQSAGRGEVENTVAAWMVEDPAEGPVRRYLSRGVAGIAVEVDTRAGDELSIEVESDGAGVGDAVEVYVFASGEGVWAAHATGDLRYVHYYQLLNQVENLVWAQEVLVDRRFTLNQPPGWSPILATAGLFVMDDLPGGNVLFLWVLVLVGFTSVRLASLLARGAPAAAWLVPGGMVAAHGLLMFEPGSTNFPDSLFAAAVLAVAAALAGGRIGWFVAMGVAAQALRWPGTVVATILAVSWWWAHRGTADSGGRSPAVAVRAGLWRLWAVVGATAVLAAAGAWVGEPVDKEMSDLGFILWFETFPEHWHGEYAPAALLARVPGFFWLWLRYTGGGLALAAIFAIGRPTPARTGARFLLAGALAYSTLLCTVDHHPTHYFLPLVALTGPAVVSAAASTSSPWTRQAISLLCLAGLWIFLQGGSV